jgi:hypothetical protein
MPSELDYAWVAGLIDGDGCITLGTVPGGYRKPLLVVDSTDPEIIDELLALFRGNLTLKKNVKPHHRQGWSWRVSGADRVLAILRCIAPYMRCSIKKERAYLLLNEYKSVTPRNGYYTPQLRLLKQDFELRFMAIGSGRGSQNRPAED